MSTELAVRQGTEMFMPIMSIESAVERYNTVVQYVQKLLHENTDFGKIPGTTKATLLKPGAEKLCTLFGLSKRFALVKDIEDWGTHGEPFFYYLYRCGLYRGDVLIAESDGSCNSHEAKYRWRKAERVCPECGKATIIKGKAEYGGGWLCWKKPGKSDGCGHKFFDGDETIEGQNVERVPNPDIADQVNTIQKMAQKRALIAATLLAVNASEFFTQDLEDVIDVQPEGNGQSGVDKSEKAAEPQKAKPAVNEDVQREKLFQAIRDAGRLLNELGDSIEWALPTANAFANDNFNTKVGVQGLSIPQLSEMAGLLSARIDSLKKPKPLSDLMESVLSHFDSEKHFNTYLTEHKYPTGDQLTDEQLNQILKDVA